jgi:hypothetical protein
MKKERNKEIIRLYKLGYPMTVLGEKYGVTRTAIWYVIRKYCEKLGVERSAQLKRWNVDK